MAIASVVLYHFNGFVISGGGAPPTGHVLQTAVDHGYRGVNLFYVISGFVLGLPFAAHALRAGRPVALGSYFLRRLTRLEPPYLLSLALCTAWAQGEAWRSLSPHLGASALYLHNLWFAGISTINPVAWSLEVEVQFYCLVPALAALFRIRPAALRRAVMVGLIVAAGVAQLVYWDAPFRLRYTIVYAVQFFLTGFVLADLYLAAWEERPRTGWGWDVLSLLCWPAIFLPADKQVWVALPLLTLAAYVSTFRGVVFRSLFRNGFVTAVGGMCYSIYLLHYVAIQPVLRVSASIWLYLAVMLGLSSVFFLRIERPCMHREWPRGLVARFRRS